jgi:hypothetical protein
MPSVFYNHEHDAAMIIPIFHNGSELSMCSYQLGSDQPKGFQTLDGPHTIFSRGELFLLCLVLSWILGSAAVILANISVEFTDYKYTSRSQVLKESVHRL